MHELLKKLNNISPYIRRAWDSYALPGWVLRERVIYDYEIVYIMEGRALISIEDRVYNAVPGEIYIFRPGVPHSMKNEGNTTLRQPHVHFDLYYDDMSEDIDVSFIPAGTADEKELKFFREDIDVSPGHLFPERIVVKNSDNIRARLFAVIREMENRDCYSELKLKALFIELLIAVLIEAHGYEEKAVFNTGANHEKLMEVSEYIRQKFRDRITLEELSKLSNLSKSHFLCLFKKYFKVSPIRYQLKIRINSAKQMVATSDSSFTEIAAYLGFLDIQHFSKTFTRHTGMSPSAYKERVREKLI